MRSVPILYLAFLLIVHLLTGCASLPNSYSGRVAAGYTGLAITNDTAAVLVIGGTISKEDGRAVLAQTRTAREVLDVAATLTGQAGEDKLQQAFALLRAAQDALCAQNATDPNCIAMRSRSQP